jgi:dynein heavy chain
MVESLREVTRKGVASYLNTTRERWVLEWPGQVVLVVTAVFWTREVSEAVASKEKGRLAVCAEHNTSQLTDIVNLVGKIAVQPLRFRLSIHLILVFKAGV